MINKSISDLDCKSHLYLEYNRMVKLGYNPIGVTIVGLESTFIFNTDEEAEKAWIDLEKLEGNLVLDDLEFTISTDDGHEWTSGVISGYWYGELPTHGGADGLGFMSQHSH